MADESKLDALRSAILAGEESGVADGGVMGEIRQHIRRHARAMGTREPSAAGRPPDIQRFEDF